MEYECHDGEDGSGEYGDGCWDSDGGHYTENDDDMRAADEC